MGSAQTEVARVRVNRRVVVHRARMVLRVPGEQEGPRRTVRPAAADIPARPVTVLLRVMVLPHVMVHPGPAAQADPRARASVAMTAVVHPDPVRPAVPVTTVRRAIRLTRVRSGAAATASRLRTGTPMVSRPCAIDTMIPRSRTT